MYPPWDDVYLGQSPITMNLTTSTNAPVALPSELRTALLYLLAICLADILFSIVRLIRDPRPLTIERLFEPALISILREHLFHTRLARSIQRPDDCGFDATTD